MKGIPAHAHIAAATALANLRGGRRGMPPVSNVLELLTPTLRLECEVDAMEVLRAAGFGELVVAAKAFLDAALTEDVTAWADKTEALFQAVSQIDGEPTPKKP